MAIIDRRDAIGSANDPAVKADPNPTMTAPYSATGDDQARRRSQSVTDDDQQRWDWRIHAGRADHECGPLLILGTVGTRSMS
jgi:hypothetical protein